MTLGREELISASSVTLGREEVVYRDSTGVWHASRAWTVACSGGFHGASAEECSVDGWGLVAVMCFAVTCRRPWMSAGHGSMRWASWTVSPSSPRRLKGAS
jgi:hypothetical protein